MEKGFSNELAYLSNYYPCRVEYEGIVYPSSEHAFAAAKTLDTNKRIEISKLETPGKAKRAGRKLELRTDWNSIRINVMRSILLRKFLQNSNLRLQLMSTGSMYLEETNYWNDTFWGVCDGVGENNLGKILMEIRDGLINGRNL